MRIRTQLIVAAFVLSVIPLAAIVTWSYHSSRRALESAYRREADRLTQQMDKRLTAIRADLQNRLTVVSALPIPTTADEGQVGDIVTVMGESASLIDTLEFHPVRPKPPANTAAAGKREAESAARREEPVAEPPEEPAKVAAVPAPAPVQRAAAAPAAAAVPLPPMVIDLGALPATRYVMSEKQKELIEEISRIGLRLSRTLTPEEREDLTAEMRASQEELHELVAADRQRQHAEVRRAMEVVQAKKFRMLADGRLALVVRHGETAAGAEATPAPPAPAPPPAAVLARPEPEPKAEPAKPAAPKSKRDEEKTAKRASMILGNKLAAPLRAEGQVVGQVTASIRPEQVIRRVLGGAGEGDEIPFAIDREGSIYARNAAERARIERLDVIRRLRRGENVRASEGWILSTTTDPQSGLRIGVVRPVADNLDELRRTAARNFGLGMGLIAFALIGIVPLSNHLTRDVKRVTEGADRIAQGDLGTRLSVKSDNELGQLARAFNRMAEDLSAHQQQLVEQERARKEQEMQQRLLSLEYDRKSVELEDARRFQLSLLPKQVPHFADFDIAVYTRTATEVGGDYYDFHAGETLAITIGDATGHGARAGTMVTVVKTLFSGYDGRTSPARFLGDAAETIKRMDLGRMAMALSLGLLQRRRLTIASAGMPPVLIHRAATGEVEEIALEATPLGTLATDYPEVSVDLHDRDTVLFMSDGFPELMDDAGQQLGYSAAQDVFAAAATGASAQAVVASLVDSVRRWHGEGPPNDDVTFVVVRCA